MSLVVCDGDLIGFKAAAASEERFIIAFHKSSGREKKFQHRTAFRDWLKEQDRWTEDDFEIKDDRNVAPIENCLHTVKVMVDKIYKSSGCKEFKVVVQGQGNFRDNLELPTKYKGGRQDIIRPQHLFAVQDYLIGKYKAELAHGQESDDVLAAYAYEGYKNKKRIVQSTIDKDAKQCMGWLYNWDKMEEPIFVTGLGGLYINDKKDVDGIGRMWLYHQILVGDSTDSYKPTELCGKRYGDKSSFKDLVELKTDKECWQKIHDKYFEWYPEPVTYTAWDNKDYTKDYLDILQMYIDCAHMRRWEGDQLSVLSTLDRLEIDYA